MQQTHWRVMALLRSLAVIWLSDLALCSEVHVSFGVLSGNTLASVDEFLGVPFAMPPVGLRRLAPSVDWNQKYDGGRRPANMFGPCCPQPQMQNSVGQDEDCLFLNIWSPRPSSETTSIPRPVMVFIPGGSFVVGGGHQYNGTQLALETGAIVVTLNHRLGALGFLLLGPEGNFGLLDQQSALRWLQREIHLFGGDPARLLLFGQSSGSESVGFQLLLPGSSGLFAGATMQSGVPVTVPGMYARDCGRQLASHLNCSGSSQELMDCLRTLHWQEVLEAQNLLTAPPANGTEWDVQCAFWPAVDGLTLPDHPDTLMRSGRFSDIPVIVGTNHDEGDVFAYMDWQKPMELNEFKRVVATVMNARGSVAKPAAVDSLLKAYDARPRTDLRTKLGQLLGDMLFTCRARRFLRLREQSPRANRQPAFKYVFAQRAANDPSPKSWGIYHSSELPFIWGTDESGSISELPSLTGSEQRLAYLMRQYWGQFAATGSPGSSSSWPLHNSTDDIHLELCTHCGLGHKFRDDQCNAWDAAWDGDVFGVVFHV